MKLHDISREIRPGMPVWPGDEPYLCRWTMRLEKGDSCNVSAVTMSVHTGTHLDAPLHFEESGEDIGSIPLGRYIGPARVVDVGPAERITAALLQKRDLRGIERLLLKTGESGRSGDRFHEDFAYVGADAAEYLVALGLLLLGTDAPSVDAFKSDDFPAHHALLGSGVAILEGIRLGEVSPGDYELVCLPLKLAGLDGSPVRAVLLER